jgi:hypothetical protein
MNAEVFRFVTIRQPRKASGTELLTLNLADAPGRLMTEIRDLRDPSEYNRLLEHVQAFTGSAEFISGPAAVDARWHEYHTALSTLPEAEFTEAAPKALERVFEANPAAFTGSDVFITFARRLGDSIVAAAIDSSIASDIRSLLVQLAADVALPKALASGRMVSKDDYLETVILIPASVLPLETDAQHLAPLRAARREAQRRAREKRLQKLRRTARDLTIHEKAIDELIGAIATRANHASGAVRRRETGHAGFVLTSAEVRTLSEGTQDVLRRAGVVGDVDIASAIPFIEARLAETTDGIHSAAPTARLVRIGDTVIPDGVFGGMATTDEADEWDETPIGNPGPCPPAALDPVDPASEGATEPTGHGEARILGIADLMVVEQQLARYELGEIAHIENVLRTEKRTRRFRTATTTEESLLTETEETEEKEKDLSSTERFELQQETQNVINENASREAGLTVNASYGPTVDATATLNVTNSTAKQQSDRAASNFARETTSRAVNRLQKRTLERRFTRTVREVEESNLHSFDNSTGSDITGIYRFVDKIYTAQIVNYGKRLMLEFVVPEPAAFWRYAHSARPLVEVPYDRPERPGYCLPDNRTFVPLQANHIKPKNYIFWASRYGAADVTPPPQRTCVVGKACKATEIKNAYLDGPLIGSDFMEVKVPDGYTPISANLNAYGDTQALGDVPARLTLQVQAQEYTFSNQTNWLNVPLEPADTVAVSINTNRYYNYELLVTVLCKLSREKFQEWQLKTYFSIMNAYEAAKSRYDAAVAAARVREEFEVSFGRNPIENREIERAELKRACISMMTGQRFETFDAMTPNVAPYGYPEIDFAEARVDAKYVQLFEQGLEWNNITYVFYPYFWSRKDEWPALVQLTDRDPLFNRFLQAGAARVQVPVRPQFKKSVVNYLSGKKVWNANGVLISFPKDDPNGQFFSVLSELKLQLGNDSVQGPGRLKVTHGQDLVIGTDTAFREEDDTDRRITISGAVYVIKNVESTSRVRLRTPYNGPTDAAVSYSLGGQLVGEPWEVRLPTDLVKLDDYAIS